MSNTVNKKLVSKLKKELNFLTSCEKIEFFLKAKNNIFVQCEYIENGLYKSFDSYTNEERLCKKQLFAKRIAKLINNDDILEAIILKLEKYRTTKDETMLYEGSLACQDFYTLYFFTIRE